MNYLSILGRQPELSRAELAALYGAVRQIAPNLATFNSPTPPDINRLGGTLKLARKLRQPLVPYLLSLPPGKITLGLSDYSPSATARTVTREAMQLKKALIKKGRSVRIVQNNSAVLSTATAHHNHLGQKPTALEIITVNHQKYLSLGAQNITAYAKRDQARPARDAKIGMLPPKLAQILINLCGPLPPGSRLLDPFCGTGVLLQEAYLMGYTPYGTDKDPRMVQYAQKNLNWLTSNHNHHPRSADTNHLSPQPPSFANQPVPHPNPANHPAPAPQPDTPHFTISVADATTHTWHPPIDAVACETYLGTPMSAPPSEMKLKHEKQICQQIITTFLKNLASQIPSGTPVTLATPAWLRPDGSYSPVSLLDYFLQKEYNEIKDQGFDRLLYHRDGQIVARKITVLRKR